MDLILTMESKEGLWPTVILFSAPALSGICLTLASLVAVDVGGPLLVNIAGTIKDVALTYIGLVFMKADKDVTQDTSIFVLAGLALSFLGASFQLLIKLNELQTDKGKCK